MHLDTDASASMDTSRGVLRVVAVSEHYFPRVGGTVNYVHETLSALIRQGVQVELWVPGPAPANWLPEGMEPPPYEVVWIDAGYPPMGDPDRDTRYRFCRMVDDMAQTRAEGADAPDLVHAVFGLFVMEVLDTQKLRDKGVRSIATVHNLPPNECRLVSPDAGLLARLKEEVRLQLVKRKNHARVKMHSYDAIVVPSDQVRGLLAPLLPQQIIDVIGHGPTADLMARMSPPSARGQVQGRPVRLLTAGGYAPHKRQHLIPQIAAILRDRGLDFEWDVVGPSGRIAGYFDGVSQAVAQRGLEDKVRIRSAAPADDLAKLYDAADIYVQPSIEEGFCITALDAAAAGLPVIASPAGALAQIAEVSGGRLVDSAPKPLSEAILQFVQNDGWGDAEARMQDVRARFSWDAAAEALRNRYDEMVNKGESSSD